MTRYEALNKYPHGWMENGSYNDYPKDEIVNKIYDDFESRSCDSCKYKQEEYAIDDRILTQCYNEKSLLFMTDLSDTDKNQTHSSFGCNHHEAKL